MSGEGAVWLEGVVERVLWAAEDRSWAIVKVRAADGVTTVVGPIGQVVDLADETPFASFEGDVEHHPLHGRQFRARAMLLGSPRTDAGVRLYLASARVKGIGEALADRIVDHFGVETTHILETAPERLREVPGVGARKAAALAEAWRADAGGRALSILLRGLGLSHRRVARVFERWGADAWEVVTRTPYRLAEEVSGIGFVIADRLALAQGVAPDAPARVEAAVGHVLVRAADEGHCHVPETGLAARLERLGVPSAGAARAVDELLGRAAIVDVSDGVGERLLADPRVAEAEDDVVSHLTELLLAAPSPLPDDAEVSRAEAAVGLVLDPGQREAVARAASAPVSVITGGPGTGKTTIVRALLALAGARGETWTLASPTGRAAKRLAEATGQDAGTLHRVLDFQPATGQFAKNATEPLPSDGLLVDESSMVDVKLAAAALRAVPSDRPFRVVWVGDADQLPSVGPGQVLRDLVDSGPMPVSRLSTVHRQGARSGIVRAAREVHAGRVPVSGEHSGDDDFFLVSRSDPDAAIQAVLGIVTERLPARGFDPRLDVQVLSPTRKGPLGTVALNDRLREALGVGAVRGTLAGRTWAVGDRVIVTRNRYDLGVFNGDLGTVVEVAMRALVVRFDDVVLPLQPDDLDDLELAWAITVHKSQGSEYPAVVLVLHGAHGIMLRRNLVYTALTRARRFFVGVGEPAAWGRAVRQQRDEQRWTRLGPALRRSLEEPRFDEDDGLR